MTGEIDNPKRPRFTSNQRFDVSDADAQSRTSRDLVDALTRSSLVTPRASGGAVPTGFIVSGFGLTLNPPSGTDKVRVTSDAGVAFDADGRLLVKDAGTTVDVTIPVGTHQIYAYYLESPADPATRHFLPVTAPFTEYPDSVDTTFLAGVGYHVRAGDQTSIVASDVVNGRTAALCFLGVAINTAGAVTMTGYNATTAPNGAYAVNRLTAVPEIVTPPTVPTRNGSIASIHDLVLAALNRLGQVAWGASAALTPDATNNFGAFTVPSQGVQRVRERLDTLEAGLTEVKYKRIALVPQWHTGTVTGDAAVVSGAGSITVPVGGFFDTEDVLTAMGFVIVQTSGTPIITYKILRRANDGTLTDVTGGVFTSASATPSFNLTSIGGVTLENTSGLFVQCSQASGTIGYLDVLFTYQPVSVT